MFLRRVLAVAVTVLVAGALQATPVAAADRHPAPTLRAASSSTPERLVQHVTVKWNPSTRRKVYTKNAVVPGIGNLALICKSNSTMIRLHTENRQLETQMWLQKYEVKHDHNVVAVKVPRIYRYPHALADGTGGTGYYAAEGLNQVTPIENYSSGTINGIISQRPGRHQSGGSLALKPVTSFELNWFWNGFRHPAQYRSCKIDAVFTTTFKNRAGITWHGTADAPGHDSQRTRLPGIGWLDLECRAETDPSGAAQTLTIEPDDPDADVYVERVFSEGWVEDHVVTQTYGYGEQEPGVLGPVPLPGNATLRLRVRVAGAHRWLLVSSYRVTNNPDPRLNLCEVSAAPYDR
ncbi:MAG: hypothetical protein Q7J48_02085 [Nocardioides sp.]|nr:hypothetical protein [Nocardioides sp.]